MDTSKPIVKLEGISFAYPGRPLIFDQFDFEFKQGNRIFPMSLHHTIKIFSMKQPGGYVN
jgi:hypothetical protein